MFLEQRSPPSIGLVTPLFRGTTSLCCERYDGAEGVADPGAPALAISFENGRIQLQRNEADDQPVLVDTGMEVAGPFSLRLYLRFQSPPTTLLLPCAASTVGSTPALSCS